MNFDDRKIVCRCFNVTVGDLKIVIDNRTESFEEIQEITSIAKGYKKCTDSVKELISGMVKDK